MTREQIVALFAERQFAWRRRDADALTTAYADDCAIASPIFGAVTGRHAVRESYRELFRAFADWSFEGTDILIDGSRVAQTFKVDATHTSTLFGMEPTGRRFQSQGVMIFELNERGEIVRERRFYDFTGMLVQLGVIKAKPR